MITMTDETGSKINTANMTIESAINYGRMITMAAYELRKIIARDFDSELLDVVLNVTIGGYSGRIVNGELCN